MRQTPPPTASVRRLVDARDLEIAQGVTVGSDIDPYSGNLGGQRLADQAPRFVIDGLLMGLGIGIAVQRRKTSQIHPKPIIAADGHVDRLVVPFATPF